MCLQQPNSESKLFQENDYFVNQKDEKTTIVAICVLFRSRLSRLISLLMIQR